MQRRIAVILLVLLLGAGCLDLFGRDDPRPSYADLGWEGRDATGRSAGDWPDLDGVTLTVLDVSDWPAMPEAIDLFEELTGADVVQELGSLDPQALTARDPEHDVVFGLDQVGLGRLVQAGTIEDYTPLLKDRVGNRSMLFEDAWPGVPYQHTYGAIQWQGSETFVKDLFDVRTHRAGLVVPDPIDDRMGRAFLLTTIGFFGEDPTFYNWKTYWRDLWTDDEGCVTVAATYEEAYEEAFMGLNGTVMHDISFGSIVHPAVLVANGSIEPEDVPHFLRTDRQTWHLVDHSVIVNNTRQLAAAQAWQEFLLTEAFQNLVEEADAYAVVDAHATDAFDEHAPDPQALRPAFIPIETIGQRWDTWRAALEEIRPESGCITP